MGPPERVDADDDAAAGGVDLAGVEADLEVFDEGRLVEHGEVHHVGRAHIRHCVLASRICATPRRRCVFSAR